MVNQNLMVPERIFAEQFLDTRKFCTYYLGESTWYIASGPMITHAIALNLCKCNDRQ